jgi:predicted DNA-binding transcriptional regulator AlpA
MPNKASTESSEDRLLDSEGVCEMLKVGMTTFRKMLEEQRFPQPIRISQRVLRWRRETVEVWIRDQETPPTGGPGRPRSGV